MPFQVGPLELVVVLAIALIVLGPKKLPEVGRSLGKGMREFKDSVTGKDKDRDENTLTAAEEVEKAPEPVKSTEQKT